MDILLLFAERLSELIFDNNLTAKTLSEEAKFDCVYLRLLHRLFARTRVIFTGTVGDF